MFRTILTAAVVAFGVPAFAGQWHFISDTEGGAEFYIFYNETGTLLDDPQDQNEIVITKLPDVNPLNEDGGCSFDNCRVRVRINGRYPVQGEAIKIEFSNGFKLDFKKGAAEDRELMNNFATVGMDATNYFDEYVRTNDWVNICFSDDYNKFDLNGATEAANQIDNYLSR